MKKCIFAFIIVLFTSNLFAQKMNVLDYFKKLPDDISASYKITNNKGKWVSNSNADYEIEVIVDTKNGYIEIEDDGTGGGSVVLNVVLYRKKDASALIGISKSTGDAMSTEHSLVFLEYKNNEWFDVSNEVLPELTFKNFMKNDFETTDYPKHFYEKSTIFYKLPQHGTSIEVSLSVGILRMICDGRLDSSSTDRNLACDFTNCINKTPLILLWDKEQRKFYER